MRLILLVFIASLVSCTNKKAQIVEEQKRLQSELKAIDSKQDAWTTGEEGKRLSSDTSFEASVTYTRKLFDFERERKRLREKIDSLEMELKKY